MPTCRFVRLTVLIISPKGTLIAGLLSGDARAGAPENCPKYSLRRHIPRNRVRPFEVAVFVELLWPGSVRPFYLWGGGYSGNFPLA